MPRPDLVDPPDDELELPDFNFDGFSDDLKFEEWNKVFITYTDATVAKEQFQGDPEQAAILASFNAQRLDQRTNIERIV
jgi:hypothetical protein